MLAAARLVFDGNGRPELSGFREAGAAAGWLVAEAASLGLRAHAIGVWNVTLARQATRLTGDYEPLTVVAISRKPTASGENGEKPRRRGGLSGFKLRRVTDYLEAHLSEQIRLTDMAAVVGMSPYHLCRIFKQSTGVAPHQWVLRQRIRSAQTLMGDRGLSLTDISYRVGFSSQAHFTTTFRKIAGMTPGQWREKHVDEPLAFPDTTFGSFAAVRC